jgi:penicillin-binding protein 2
MFHRRLLLLAVAFALLMFVLGAQMIRLSVVEGAERRAAAEAKLEIRELLATYRGSILDRHGRVLAVDRASDDLALEYSVITGTWARTQAYETARKAIGRAKWSSLSPQERETLIQQRLPEFRRRIEDLFQEICRVCAIDREELQQRMDDIKASVQSSAAVTWERQFRHEQERFGISEDEFRPEPIIEQRSAHIVVPRLESEQAFALRRLGQEHFAGMLEIQASRRREYPWLSAAVPLNRATLPRDIRDDQVQMVTVSGVGDHILGSVRDEAFAEDIARRPLHNPKTGETDLGGYRAGDSVGARGIERAFEDILRGRRGEIRQRIDTGEKIRAEPQPGANVQLTIDIALQARVQAILSNDFGLTIVQGWQQNTLLPLGTPLNSAAVVIDVETGEVLAMVSMPTMAMGEQMSDDMVMIHHPQVNRACEAVYPPGSIIKPLVLAAAVSEGLHDLDTAITCTGHYFPNVETIARCWLYRPHYGMRDHGPLQAEEALARSCNIFFYTLADRLGIERLRDWLKRFGLGQRLNIGLTLPGPTGKPLWSGEHGGDLPSDAQIAALKKAGGTDFAEISMGIGQGITWTPLHAANAYATLARRGVIRDATLVLHDPRGSRPQRTGDLNLSDRLVSAAIEGLRQSVEEPFGTGHHITHTEDGTTEPILNADGVTVWAKTGTAQAPLYRTQDTNNNGKIDGDDAGGIPKLDHSWFVGLVGPMRTKPLFAIAVIVEYGGSGGRTAGPIANQIIRALQTEGYLPGDATAPPRDATTAGAAEPEPEDDGGDD